MFDDYPKMGTFRYVSNEVVEAANNLLGHAWVWIKWLWILIFLMTLIVVVYSLVRMAILADDIPLKKAQAKHDLATSLVVLALMGGIPTIFAIIINLLNGTF